MAFSDPKQIMVESGLREGSMVADFGAGSGHYSIAAGKLVGGRGRVYAIDIQKDLLARLKQEASAQDVPNVEVIWGDLEAQGGSKLKDGTIDMVILANALFQMHHRHAAIAEVQRVLKSGGRLLLVDWQDSFGGMGPQPADVVTEAVARELLTKTGFELERTLKNAGEHHYGLIFKKK